MSRIWSPLAAAIAAPSPVSLIFFAFVLVVLVIYYSIGRRCQGGVLLIASYLFCAAWSPVSLAVVVASSVVTFLVALRLRSAAGATHRKWLWMGLAANLAGLIAFKYVSQTWRYASVALAAFGFSSGSLSLAIIQPIGLSFYTLQAISYLLDVYRGQLPASRSFVEVSLYLSYFPKLLAGPIERAPKFLEQLRAKVVLDNGMLAEGLVKILVGLVRKRVISDPLSRVIPADVFSQPLAHPAPDLLFWWIVAAIVIYNDFAGYTSVARGVSQLFGIQLSPNFQQPFFSTGFIDFWNRWHMSLSSWLRDYIYLPVSRAMLRRNISGRNVLNLALPPLVTMFISGLWHGAIPHLLLWGVLNGAVQGAERIHRSRQRLGETIQPRWRRLLVIPSTLLAMLVISVPFQLEVPETFQFWGGLLHWSAPQSLHFPGIIEPVFGIALSLLLDAAELPRRDETGWLTRKRMVQAAALAAGMVILFLATREQVAAPFVYQAF